MIDRGVPLPSTLRRDVCIVAVANLAYFGIEFGVATAIGSVALFADSVDFLEDASVNGLILLAMRWSRANQARVGMGLAALLLVPSLATVWTAWRQFQTMAARAPFAMTAAGTGALAVNAGCALLLTRHRHRGGSLTRAAFLSARNDALASVAIIVAGLTAASVWRSAWPDLVVGIGVGLLNAGAAREVWRAAREERRTARA